jgi:hypothetical protein
VFERSKAIGLLITHPCALDHLATGISKGNYSYLLIRPLVSWGECVNSIDFITPVLNYKTINWPFLNKRFAGALKQISQ